MSFLAKYDGRCGICEEPFGEGDEVEFVDDELCHAECAEEDREI
jgi:hypothetical protein